MIQGPFISAGERESRRRLWYTLMELDLQTSIQLYLPCTFRWENVTCISPGNFDESQIEVIDKPDVPIPRPSIEEVTENHLQAYASETLKVRTQASELLARTGAFDYAQALIISRQLGKTLVEIARFFPTALGTPKSAPSSGHPEWRRRVFLDLHVRLPLMAIYRRFGLRDPHCPPEVRRCFLASSMTMLALLEVDHGGGASSDGCDPSVTRMVLSMLRGPLIHAALVVCHFIKSARGADWQNGVGGVSEIFGWKVDRLLRAVDTALEKLLGLVEMAGSVSVSDLISLSIVREVVQAGSVGEKVGEVQVRFDRILGACSKVAASVPPVSCFSGSAFLFFSLFLSFFFWVSFPCSPVLAIVAD
jgi:hypothetical protein